MVDATVQDDDSGFVGLQACTDGAAMGFGIIVEAHCAPSEYSGAATVVDVQTVGEGTRFLIELSELEVDEECPFRPRLMVSRHGWSPNIPLELNQRLQIEARSEAAREDNANEALFVYAVVRDEASGELIFVHHNYDDRFFHDAELAIADTFNLEFGRSCSAEAVCYLESVSYRLVDPKLGVDIGERESATIEVAERSYGIFVTSVRYSSGWRTGECPGGHYDPGLRVGFSIVAQ
jgi:hypothetical protein